MESWYLQSANNHYPEILYLAQLSKKNEGSYFSLCQTYKVQETLPPPENPHKITIYICLSNYVHQKEEKEPRRKT